MDCGSTLAGVPIRRRSGGTKTIPMIVISTENTSPSATVVCTAVSVLVESFAPRYRAMTTPAPMAIPLKNPTIMKIRFPDELTAASALLPTKFPTIMESTAL